MPDTGARAVLQHLCEVRARVRAVCSRPDRRLCRRVCSIFGAVVDSTVDQAQRRLFQHRHRQSLNRSSRQSRRSRDRLWTAALDGQCFAALTLRCASAVRWVAHRSRLGLFAAARRSAAGLSQRMEPALQHCVRHGIAVGLLCQGGGWFGSAARHQRCLGRLATAQRSDARA